MYLFADPPPPHYYSATKLDGAGADNPDNLYQSANLDSRETYRLYGKRGTVNYLGFGTQAGSYGQAGGLATVVRLFLHLKWLAK